MDEFTGTPITETHDPCGYWNKYPTTRTGWHPKTINTSVGFDFHPVDMCMDSSHIYVCGYKITGGDYTCRLVKLSKETFAVVDSVEYDASVGSAVEKYEGVKVDGTYVYLCGYGKSSSEGFVHKRLKTDLSSLEATYTYAVAAVDCYLREPEIDKDYVYVVGLQGAAAVVKVKLNIADLSLVWEYHNTATNPNGLVQSGNFIYLIKHYGGLCSVEKVNKTTAAATTHNYNNGALYRGSTDDEHIYAVGVSPSSGDVQGAVFKILLADMSKVWMYQRNTTSPGNDQEYRCRFDGNYVYSIGTTNGADTVLTRLTPDGDLDGEEILSGKLAGYTLLEEDTLIYLAYWNTAEALGFVESRFKEE
jgi:hypothetical protein